MRVVGSTEGVDPGFLEAAMQVAQNAGATEFVITSGKRSDATHPGGPTNTGAKDSNHLRGLALDGYAIIGGRQVPFAQLPGLAAMNIRSGMSFLWKGKPDAAHIDAGYRAQQYTPPANAQLISQQSGQTQSAFNTAVFTPGQIAFINEYSRLTGLDPGVVAAEVYNESNINTPGPGGARAREAAGDHDWLNIGRTDTGPMGAGYAAWRNPITAAQASAAWVAGHLSIPGFGRAAPGIQGIARAAGQSPAAQIKAIQTSGWASSGYPNLPGVYSYVTGGRAPSTAPPPIKVSFPGYGPPVTSGGQPSLVSLVPEVSRLGLPQLGPTEADLNRSLLAVRRMTPAARVLPSQRIAPITHELPNLTNVSDYNPGVTDYAPLPRGQISYADVLSRLRFQR